VGLRLVVVVEGIGAGIAVTRIDGVVGDGGDAASASSLRVGVGTTSSNTSETQDHTDHNTNDGRSSEHDGDDEEVRGTAVSRAVGAGAIETEVKLTLVVTSIVADDRDRETALEGIAHIVRAEVIVSAGDVGMRAANGRVARVVGAYALIVAVVGGEAGVDTAPLHVTLIEGASVLVVAGDGAVLPLAELSGEVALVEGARVAVVALKVTSAFTLRAAELLSGAETGSSLAGIGEAGGISLAGNGGGDARSLDIVAAVVEALVGGVLAGAGSLLAADARDSRGVAEAGGVALIGRSALTAHTETAAATAGINVLLAGTGDEVEGILSEVGEVSVAEDALSLLVSDNHKLIHGYVTVSTDTDSVDLNVRDLSLGIVSGSLEVIATLGTVLGAVITIDVVVVIAVSDDDEDLLDTRAAELELIDTHAHAGGDGGTAAAARVIHVLGGGAADEIVHGGLDVGIRDTLSHSKGGPGRSVEVDEGEVSSHGTIGEHAREARDEVLLVLEFSLRDGARAVEDDREVNGLTALAASRRDEDGLVNSTGLDIGQGELTEVLEDNAAGGARKVELSHISRGACLPEVFLARATVDGLGGARGRVVGGGSRLRSEELGHGGIIGASLARASATRAVHPLIVEGTVGDAQRRISTSRVEGVNLLIVLAGIVEAISTGIPVIGEGTLHNATLHEGVAKLEVSSEGELGGGNGSKEEDGENDSFQHLRER
jgi:hypothetical protein